MWSIRLPLRSSQLRPTLVPMPITFPCPACKRAQVAAVTAIGNRWRCECGVETLVPSPPKDPLAAQRVALEVERAKLEAERAALRTPASPSLDAERLELERQRLEAERAKIELERERAKVAALGSEKPSGRLSKTKTRTRTRWRKPDGPKRDPRLAAILTMFVGAGPGWWYAGGCVSGLIGLGTEVGALVFIHLWSLKLLAEGNTGSGYLGLLGLAAVLRFVQVVVAHRMASD